jgi:hypothetical protein
MVFFFLQDVLNEVCGGVGLIPEKSLKKLFLELWNNDS